MPCGAGKTLVGIQVALRVKKRTLIICDSLTSVNQWERSFLQFTHVEKSRIVKITG